MKFRLLAALILVVGFVVGCRNLTTDDPYVDEIERVMREVQAYYFYDYDRASDGFISNGDGIPDYPSDKGEFGGTCADYATEFCERYSGKSYLIVTNDDGKHFIWSELKNVLANGTFDYRSHGSNGGYSSFAEGGFYEHDGTVKDHRLLIVRIETSWTLESSYEGRVSHAWNVVATPDNRWFLVDTTTTNDRTRVLKEVNAPDWAK